MSELVFNFDLLQLVKKEDYIFLIDDKLTQLPKVERSIMVSVTSEIKSLEYFQKLTRQVLALGVHRNTHLVVIGGGTLSDLGGFLASTILRGISWSVVPTTLLAQVDAAIGGKTGLNLDGAKNLIGSFHQPQKIYIKNSFLKSLPPQEMASGKGEILKYGFLNKEIYQKMIIEHSLEEVVKLCADYKLSLTERDPKESGERILLNLGHTLGHAIESLSDYPHGICVALGLEIILKMYHPELLPTFKDLTNRLEMDLTSYTIPVFSSLKEFLKLDKKRSSKDHIQVIIPKDVGECIVKEVSLAQFYQKLERLL